MRELWGVAEIADAFDVGERTVHGWTERYPDFPAPVAELKQGRVWTAGAVRRWHARSESKRRSGRPKASG
jgi:hypothetical protein